VLQRLLVGFQTLQYLLLLVLGLCPPESRSARLLLLVVVRVLKAASAAALVEPRYVFTHFLVAAPQLLSVRVELLLMAATLHSLMGR
jgi:hypothetical protein